jgi:hypothetical protein
VYIALGAVEVVLMTRYARKGLEPEGTGEGEWGSAAGGTPAAGASGVGGTSIPALTY